MQRKKSSQMRREFFDRETYMQKDLVKKTKKNEKKMHIQVELIAR